jgi:hypothetical protein
MKKVALTKNEIKFILNATHLKEGFMDYENNNNKEFKHWYGYTKGDAEKIGRSLQEKLRPKPKP